MRRAALGLLCLVPGLALAGCGQIPQPFRHDGTIADIARPTMFRGLTVRPVEALPEGGKLAEAVVKSLETHEIPAVVRAGSAVGLVIEGHPARMDGRNGLEWIMRAPDGATRSVAFAPLPIAGPLDPIQARGHADAVAARVAAEIAGPGVAPAPAATAPAVAERPKVRVTPFAGLPGDGDRALFAALTRALEQGGLAPVETGGDYVMDGKVTIVPGLPGEETVVMTWTLRSAAGAEIAVIDQEGVVPRGRLDAPWGRLARDIAEGGAAGVADALAAMK